MFRVTRFLSFKNKLTVTHNRKHHELTTLVVNFLEITFVNLKTATDSSAVALEIVGYLFRR